MRFIKNNKKNGKENIRREEVARRLFKLGTMKEKELFKIIDSNLEGLTNAEVDRRIRRFGENKITYSNTETMIQKVLRAFVNPFSLVLIGLAIISFFTDYIIASPEDKSLVTVSIITIMVTLSGALRFIQEGKSNKAGEKLKKMIKTTASVCCEGEFNEIDITNIVIGDIVKISAGDMIPADLRILDAKDLFISQSSITGESEPIEKCPKINLIGTSHLDLCNIAYMGTNVISGFAIGIVIGTGNKTYLGTITEAVTEKREETNFDKGVNSVSFLLIKFMACMVPIVFFINGITKGDWLEALLFGLSIAVGLTPEMLPMIVTTNLAKGAVKMSKRKTIVKNLNAIQNFGAIDILCTDKTGTLTEDKIILEQHLDIHGNEDIRVLRHGYLNSYFQTGLKNLLDIAILEYGAKEGYTDFNDIYEKVDEIPFDFNRRRMSVVLRDKNLKTQLITKGAIEEILNICSFAEYKNEVVELKEEIKEEILETVNCLNESGMRVIGIAQKNNPAPEGKFSVKDEKNMVLMGYISFLDPPKESAVEAIESLYENGIKVKVLTGDNEKVTRCVCKKVKIDSKEILLGSDLEKISDEKLIELVEEVNIFAKLSPNQKARIVSILKKKGHVVGFMGDGINDAPAMRKADVGISVDTAVDIAKESADVILLEKDLRVLKNGVIEGRKIFANIIKYIKMTASSNFGNMFSVLIAGIFLPFLPMMPIQILVLNLIYDISCISIPWDNVDSEYLKKPRKWDASSIGNFMKWIGPTSSIFDILTYIIMYFIICPLVLGGGYNDVGINGTMFASIFATGWFIESLWSQTLVIHMIRTPKIPFIQSRASKQLLISTSIGIIVGTILPYTSLGKMLGMAILPGIYFIALIIIIMLYMILVTIVKKIYVKKFGELL
ncbi:magnesium-translocating P-type ATPase [uncultured Clostridium sp.]|uniref:magnesium-translocating P-type ATPase n=1 Tax=uncultured Clostridium sp. TaxID=59620 RepID=UPI002604DD45|nr:magnesium-translocating P-type ATPase [uncultured Clostridium sp.]